MIVTVANQKGGVGKTTTVVNLAAALGELGKSVLVVDLDPQGNATTGLGVSSRTDNPGVYDVLIEDTPMAQTVVTVPESDKVRLVPASLDLAGAEIELVSMVAREYRLRKALAAYLDEQPTDVVLIDCPPSLGLLTLNALVATEELLIPIQCEYYALEGLGQLIRTVDMVREHLNPSLRISSILLTMTDSRTNLSAQGADEVRAFFGDRWAGLYAIDQGGGFTAQTGRLSLHGQAIQDRGFFIASQGVDGVITVERAPGRDPVDLSSHLGVFSAFWR